MGFILRILFSGLIVFIPSQDGQKVTVLLLNVPHNHQLSDATVLAEHKPLLVARAGACSGQCPKRDPEIAHFLYLDQPPATALDSLEAAVTGGGAWQLASSELSIHKANVEDPDLPSLSVQRNVRSQIVPTTSAEREDFDWVADLTQICPDGCSLDPAVHDAVPPGLIAARLVLRTGNLFTYSIAKIGTNVTPVHFNRLDGTGSASAYSQAVATWVAADIAVDADSVQIVDTKFDGSSERSMTLSPDENGKVEVAVINLPPFVPPAAASTATPEVGKHFEAFYDLAETPPALSARYVPRAGAASGAPSYSTVTWQSVHPTEALWSDLLNALRMNIGRTVYEQLLCPPSQGQP